MNNQWIETTKKAKPTAYQLHIGTAKKEQNIALKECAGRCAPAKNGFGRDNWRRLGAEIATSMQQREISSVAIESPAKPEDIRKFVEGFLLGQLKVRWSIKGQWQDCLSDLITINTKLTSFDAQIATEVETLVRSVAFGRWLVATPPNFQSPEQLCQQISAELAGFNTEIIDRKQIDKLGLGLHQAVGFAGRDEALLVAQYIVDQSLPTVMLVGKGIIFDSGGLDLKSPPNMLKMKYDMGGAAAVAGIGHFVAQMQSKINVIVLVAAAENLPGQGAMRPSDVYVSHHGESVEITNTDAEGRLVLADALSYGTEQFDPDITLNIATLTGAATTIAGWNSVVTGRHEKQARAFYDAAMVSGEKAVCLPLWQEFGDELTSDVADCKNATNTPKAGTLSAASFLSKFAPENWLHLDIAANAWNNEPNTLMDSGPTGAGIRSGVYWLQSLIQKSTD